MNPQLQLPPLSLYIHIPWCVRKCPYCDFNSHAKPSDLPVADYVDALLRDLKADRHWSQGRKLTSIFFGGGTPSLFPAEAIGRILDGVNALVPIANSAEITLETNPGTAEYCDFHTLKSAGVNRLSFGAQSFNDHHLATLGRIHKSNEIRTAISRAKQAGFRNFNIDLMHGLPQQEVEEAIHDLESAMALEPTHISWYQLTIEPNTAFYTTQPQLPDEDVLSQTYFSGLELLQTHGFMQYEVSAFAKANKESLHNLNYWRFGDYLAIGAGAHGKITEPDANHYLRYNKTRIPQDYLNDEKAFTAKTFSVPEAERPLEFFMNALRLKHGIETKYFEERTGTDLKKVLNKVTTLQNEGLLCDSASQLCTTDTGFNYLNEVLERFQ